MQVDVGWLDPGFSPLRSELKDKEHKFMHDGFVLESIQVVLCVHTRVYTHIHYYAHTYFFALSIMNQNQYVTNAMSTLVTQIVVSETIPQKKETVPCRKRLILEVEQET